MLLPFVLRNEIDLVEDDRFRLLSQYRRVRLKFTSDRLVILDRVGLVEGHDINNMHDALRSLDVPEKVMPKTSSIGRSCNQPRNVCDNQSTMS